MTKEDKKLELKICRIKKLLKNFDLYAFGFDPVVRCYILGDGVKRVVFDETTWEFIEPLLRELVKLRNIMDDDY